MPNPHRPKHLHIVFKHILSKFNAYNMNAHTHTQTPTHKCARAHTHPHKLQALVYKHNYLPSTTAGFSYAIGSRKQSANEHFFVSAQTVMSLLQTTQIKQDISFIAANKVYTSTNKTTIIWIKTELFLLPRVDVSHVYMGALALGCFYSHISIQTIQRVLTTSVDSCAKIKSAPSVV